MFSYLLCGCEDHHLLIRHALVDFTIANASTFLKHCTKITFEEHTSRMKYETVWGTDIELHAIACSLSSASNLRMHSKEQKYVWSVTGSVSSHCLLQFDPRMLRFPNESLKAS